MRKKLVIVSILIIGILGLSACGKKVADEEKIKLDLEADVAVDFLAEGEKIDSVVIAKRQTEKEQKLDVVWCTVTTSNTEVSCEKEVIVTYGLYDEGGWILDDVSISSYEDWVVTPLNGIKKEDIMNSLQNQTVTIDGEDWQLSREVLDDISIIEQTTNLENKEDQVTISVQLNELVETAQGEMEVRYLFDKEWKLDTVLSSDGFIAEMKPECALNVTEDDLKQELTFYELTYMGENSKNTLSQSMDEIVDFVIKEQISESKGTLQKYLCSYQLHKKHVCFQVEAEVYYLYNVNGSWNAYVGETSSEALSYDITGNWVGTYSGVPYSGVSEMQIEELADGTFSVVYRFTPEEINKYSQPGSYQLSGKWDNVDLRLELIAGEWIEKPQQRIMGPFMKEDITANLSVEEEVFRGSAQEGYYFTIQRKEDE